MTTTGVRSLVRSLKKTFRRETECQGHIDNVCSSSQHAIGWVFKRNDGKPEVDIYVNGVFQRNAVAEIARQDLSQAGLSQARGFDVPLHSFLNPGVNEIDIRFSHNGRTLPNGRKTINLDGSCKPILTAETYEQLYETTAQHDFNESIGGGDYYEVGRTEFELLLMEGLKPTDTMIDFGCGNGRLAVHVVPFLQQGGTYIGVDIAQTYLEKAANRIAREVPNHSCDVKWVHQTSTHFAFADQSVNRICAFSVFTHMEHEDTYNYLKAALRIMKPGGKFIFSCLPMHLTESKHIFLHEAELLLDARWGKVRNITTTMDFMSEIAEMAGWKVSRWYEGDQKNIGIPGGVLRNLGQSSCVLEAP